MQAWVAAIVAQQEEDGKPLVHAFSTLIFAETEKLASGIARERALEKFKVKDGWRSHAAHISCVNKALYDFSRGRDGGTLEKVNDLFYEYSVRFDGWLYPRMKLVGTVKDKAERP